MVKSFRYYCTYCTWTIYTPLYCVYRLLFLDIKSFPFPKELPLPAVLFTDSHAALFYHFSVLATVYSPILCYNFVSAQNLLYSMNSCPNRKENKKECHTQLLALAFPCIRPYSAILQEHSYSQYSSECISWHIVNHRLEFYWINSLCNFVKGKSYWYFDYFLVAL